MLRTAVVIIVHLGLLTSIPKGVFGADQSLVLHLSFDDAATLSRDSSSYENPVIGHGDPAWIEAGVRGGAAKLDGVDDYFDCGNREKLHLGNGNFTFEAWIRTATRDEYMVIASTGRYGVGYGCFHVTINAENLLNTDYRCRDEENKISWRRRQAPPTMPPLITRQPINNGRWHHVAIVVDRDHNSGIPRLYRDGVEVTKGRAAHEGTLPASAIVVTNSDPFFIGAQIPEPHRFFCGYMDEVKLYRRALSKAEITDCYQSKKISQEPPPPLLEEEIELPEVTELDWEMDEFVIMPWGGPSLHPTTEGNDALPQVIKDAHFNVVLCSLDKLDLCREWGFKALLTGVSPQQASRLKGDDVVWGYMLKDEPQDYSEYPPLARRMQQLREADPTHPAYINLGGSLQGHHPLYLDIVRPDILSYDYYQWSWGQESHFSRLVEYRKAALEHEIPLLVWVHGNAGPPEIREDDYYYHAPDNQQRMRQSVFTSIAYGAKGIQWFHGKHIFAGDQLRPNGEDVAVINAELRKLGPVLVQLESKQVYHTLPLPPATQQIPDNSWVRVPAGQFVLGLMKQPEQPDADYLVLANRDHTTGETLFLEFTRRDIGVEKMNKKTGDWEVLAVDETGDIGRVTFPVAAGDGELLRVR